jgi:EAL domain-containing protein (putative c-di-GMP-specific phosphodiesterase class I)
MDLKEQRLIGLEALIRWDHPKRGLIYPMEFIPLAEENGLINSIGEWMIRESCRQLSAWQAEYPMTPPLKMSMNISGKQFSQTDLAEKLQVIVGEARLNPDTIALEITESMLMHDIDHAVTTMNRLREMGFHIHIDDFGTDYSSLRA